MTVAPNVRLGDYVKIRGGGTPRRDIDRYFLGNIPWVTPKDMKVWELYDAELRITEEALRNSAAALVPANTVLLVVRSGVLKHTVPGRD
jgi:type I restriction enzyme S subunit